MEQTNGGVRAKQIAFQITDSQKYELLRKIAKKVNDGVPVKKVKKNCKHCYGRGFIGYYNGVKSLPVKCRCVWVPPILGDRKHV